MRWTDSIVFYFGRFRTRERAQREIYNMLQPFLEEEDAWCYWVVSVGALLSFLGLVAACICSCRRNENKNEFLGLAGMVTLNNSETDNFNRILTLDISQVVKQDVNDGKRTTSANRSLPDIPKDKSRQHEDMIDSVPQDIYETTEIMGDHSELYATVQDAAQEQVFDRETQDTILQGCSLLQDTSHQYTRFASPVSDNVEHPYAQLQNIQTTEASQINRNDVNEVTNIEKPSTSMDQSNGNPIAPPRTRRSSSHNLLLNSETHYDIHAANAISGGVQANQDLPYMTPPLLMLLPYPPHSQQNSPQQHFSGDSQDSKGYTSISVREPLANIIAQTKATYRQNQSTRPIIDPHYATVSDDSDEMYAAIDEQDKVYTSGSETYAQIQPMASEVQRQTQHEQIVFCQLLHAEETHSVPQPPSVNSLRHVAHAHSRQAIPLPAPGLPVPVDHVPNQPNENHEIAVPHGLLAHGLPIHGPPVHGPPVHGPPVHGLPIYGLPVRGLPPRPPCIIIMPSAQHQALPQSERKRRYRQRRRERRLQQPPPPPPPSLQPPPPPSLQPPPPPSLQPPSTPQLRGRGRGQGTGRGGGKVFVWNIF